MSMESATTNLSGIEDSFRVSADGKCSLAGRGMVATAFADATNAGVVQGAAGSRGYNLFLSCGHCFDPLYRISTINILYIINGSLSTPGQQKFAYFKEAGIFWDAILVYV